VAIRLRRIADNFPSPREKGISIMTTRSLAAVTLALGILCLAAGGIDAPTTNSSGSFAIAGAILIGSGLLSLAIRNSPSS
jgi:hypothetical protein